MRSSKHLRLAQPAACSFYPGLFALHHVRNYSENGRIVTYAEGGLLSGFRRCRLAGLFHGYPFYRIDP